jgi:serine/threonine protein kinase/lipoprotein NlpI
MIDMSPARTDLQREELDDFVRSFEEACSGPEPIDLEAFLPDLGHPLYVVVLRELVRIDLEHRWSIGQPRSLADYQSSFADLFRDPESRDAIAFEEYRLRRQAGEDATPDEYVRQFGVDPSAWPTPQAVVVGGGHGALSGGCARTNASPTHRGPGSAHPFAAAATAYLGWRREQPGPAGAAGQPSWKRFAGSADHADVFDELHRFDPVTAESLAQAVTAMPSVGGEFLGFRLLAELGSGTFGRVYLSRQGDLAERLVVLKIAPHLFDESGTLAQLQHRHIAPIYSVHQSSVFKAVCMPFVGTITLADILKDLRTLPALPVSGNYILDRLEAGTRDWETRSVCPPAQRPGSERANPRAPLANLSYVEGILWLAARLADALAHAHGRGIVHRDLKPANILLTDDGQPMLLDFNLSADNKLQHSATAARLAGTLSYMAPEQLAAIENGTCQGDERTDLYSFGIVLYELLTGRDPVARKHGSLQDVVRSMVLERSRPPLVRCSNPAVSPGAESIVRHCLEPEPYRRYQTAGELCEDLTRQLEHRPLRYAPEPSLREQAAKWTRRNPRLTFAAGVAIVASIVVLVLAAAFLVRLGHLARLGGKQEAEQARLRAVAARHELHEDLKSIEFLLGSNIPGSEHEQHREGIELAQKVLNRHQVLESRDWRAAPLVRALTPENRAQVLEDMGEVLLLLSGVVARQAQLDLAVRLNDLAAGCYPPDGAPTALWRQRALLGRSAGRADLTQPLEGPATKRSPLSPRDRYLLLLTEYNQRGRGPEDLALMNDASRVQKDNFAVWLILGNTYAELAKRNEAVECYDMASALRPQSHWPALYRGLAYLEQRNDRAARAAFDDVLRLKPDSLETYYNRALASYHLGDLGAAQADLTHIIDQSNPSLRAYILRSRVRTKLGDRDGARHDREKGLRGEPRDERDWTARGLERQPRDPQSALADFESALKLNPRYLTALMDKANVLAETLGRTDEAIAALDVLLGFFPQYVPARAGRGVLNARLGRRQAAHADALEAIRTDSTPYNTYQVAGIYALTSRQTPDDRREAVRLLETALAHGIGADLLEKDRDLDPIRHHPDFQQLVERARARRSTPTPSGAKPHGGVEGRQPTGHETGPARSSA